MKLVVDASVAIKFALIERDSDLAAKLQNDFRAGVHELLAPDIFPAEVGHALTRAERKRLIPDGQAAALFADVMNPAPDLCPTLPLMARAIELSSQSRTGVYDCLYLLLAEECDCRLVTADDKLAKSFAGSSRILLLSQLA